MLSVGSPRYTWPQEAPRFFGGKCFLEVRPLYFASELSLWRPAIRRALNPYSLPKITQQLLMVSPFFFDDELGLTTVAIYDEVEGQLCTGVILSEELILTAAHCVFSFPESVTINFVQDFRGEVPPEFSRRLVDYEIYSGWESRMTEAKDTGDLALLQFSGGLPAGYRPARLLPESEIRRLRIETSVSVIGFGMTDATDINSAGVLHKTQVKIENPQFAETEITFDQTEGTGICHGDSGGPAFLQVGTDFYLFGIAARGIRDFQNRCNQSVAYTKIWMYQAWIERAKKRLLNTGM